MTGVAWPESSRRRGRTVEVAAAEMERGGFCLWAYQSSKGRSEELQGEEGRLYRESSPTGGSSGSRREDERGALSRGGGMECLRAEATERGGRLSAARTGKCCDAQADAGARLSPRARTGSDER